MRHLLKCVLGVLRRASVALRLRHIIAAEMAGIADARLHRDGKSKMQTLQHERWGASMSGAGVQPTVT